jgi:hypothetical protein
MVFETASMLVTQSQRMLGFLSFGGDRGWFSVEKDKD